VAGERRGLVGWRRHGQTLSAAGAMAILCGERGLWADAARLGGASLAAEGPTTLWRDPRFDLETAQWQALFAATPCRAANIESWVAEGRLLDESGVADIGQRIGQRMAAMTTMAAPK
jgi:hypothetical protein